eukprot:gnl/TRDRNA2_/TRDRNA2_126547_c0_seq1.p1 gnl/TRDRNA2_/TRDRNA2_126547_c0~~gnl/TRDRNA2_/TRDRNA2_126547_c0_seq1.p1  ORF type:complete len:460 (-),score=58.56 gnl/TRDRNA2_/TRDRNA2_126547_c0_seq1:156-1535(-)
MVDVASDSFDGGISDGPPLDMSIRVTDTDSSFVLGTTGIQKLPGFVTVPAEVAQVIAAFVEARRGTLIVPQISGGRCEVFLTGSGSKPFLEYVQKHMHGHVMLPFLHDLEAKLSIVARANGGNLSPDIVALVGARDMQVPHLDLFLNQVQVIVALTQTTPTLVYDPAAEKPSAQQVAEAIGLHEKITTEKLLAPLINGGSPLVLPVSELYRHMVPACADFGVGDAVQIRDGIVHAGPKCEEVSGTPRIVVFSTYTLKNGRHYAIESQYKTWDWAFFPQVPAMVAYNRLREMYRFSMDNDLHVEPWMYHGKGAHREACKQLCTSPSLDPSVVEQLVHAWRTGDHFTVKRPKEDGPFTAVFMKEGESWELLEATWIYKRPHGDVYLRNRDIDELDDDTSDRRGNRLKIDGIVNILEVREERMKVRGLARIDWGQREAYEVVGWIHNSWDSRTARPRPGNEQ